MRAERTPGVGTEKSPWVWERGWGRRDPGCGGGGEGTLGVGRGRGDPGRQGSMSRGDPGCGGAGSEGAAPSAPFLEAPTSPPHKCWQSFNS